MKPGIRLLDWHLANAILNHTFFLSFGIGADRFSPFLRGARGELRVYAIQNLRNETFAKKRIQKDKRIKKARNPLVGADSTTY